MEGSDALVSDDVKYVFITGTERTPCAKRRCRRKQARVVNASLKDTADGTATTAESAVDGATSILVEIADLDSKELDWSLLSLIAEQKLDLELKHICAVTAATTNRPSTKETLPQSATVKSYVQQWECLAIGSGLPHRRRKSALVVSTAPLSKTATDPNGGINTLVKKTTLSVSKTRSRASVGHVTRVQSVKIGINRQHVHKLREGSAVASDDATSASMIRTRVGVWFVTTVPWIGITLQHASTRCRRRDSNDGSLLWTERHSLGWRLRIDTPRGSTLHQP